MDIQQRLTELLEQIAEIADGTQQTIRYMVLAGVLATAYLGWKVYTPESALWWNLTKCGLLALPCLIWLFVWGVLSQLKQAPELVTELVSQEDGVFQNLSDLSLDKKQGVRSLFSTLRAFKQEEGLELVFDTIGGITLLANPFFAILALLAALALIGIILIVPFVLIF